MAQDRRVIGIAVDPEETEKWTEALTEQAAASGLALTVDADAAPGDVDYLVYNIDSGVSDFAPYTKLRAILNTWAGVESVVARLDWPDHVAFCRMVERGMTIGMTEYFLAHAMRYHMGVDRMIALSAEARWEDFQPPLAEDRSVGVLGLGQLGTAIAARMVDVGFQVHGWARTERALPGVTCHHGPEGLAACLAASEILCVILPSTPATENILNAETLALLPKGAFVINAGRGPLIDDEALLAALASGQVAHATLDVFREEPLPRDHAYWRHPQVTVTPHIAAFTRTGTGTEALIDQIRRDMDGQPFLHIVDRTLGY